MIHRDAFTPVKLSRQQATGLTGVSANGPSASAGRFLTETVSCNFCGGSDYALYDRIEAWSIVKCRRCGLCFTNPRPTVESLPSFYTLGYFKDEDQTRFGIFSGDGSPYVGEDINHSKKITDVECHLSKRGSLLEIGAATGAFLRVMRDRGWKVCGVEISPDAVEAASKYEGVSILCGALEDFQSEEKFDAICMYQSLEHVPDPAYVIERSYELLNSGGVIVIEVPNLDSFDIKWSRKRRIANYDLPLHLTHFTPAVLEKKLRSTGFDIVDVDLYYPQFLLRATSFLNRNRAGANVEVDNGKPAGNSSKGLIDKNAPLIVEQKSWKATLLNYISRIFPGWRLTIIARK